MSISLVILASSEIFRPAVCESKFKMFTGRIILMLGFCHYFSSVSLLIDKFHNSLAPCSSVLVHLCVNSNLLSAFRCCVKTVCIVGPRESLYMSVCLNRNPQ